MVKQEEFKKAIIEVPNFPIEGVSFKDISPVLSDNILFYWAIRQMRDLVERPDYWVGVDSRGFLFAGGLASLSGSTYSDGIIMCRKKGKLPPPVESYTYQLEYGEDTLEMKRGEGTVVIVDDVYATGGTMEAVEELCKRAGYTVIDKLCFIDLQYLHDGVKCKSLVQYE